MYSEYFGGMLAGTSTSITLISMHDLAGERAFVDVDAVVPDAGSRFEDPERQLLDPIPARELDEHLVAIAAAVHARGQLLHMVRSARAIAELCVGDTVMFTNRIRPRYLEHQLAEVTEVDDRTLTIRLWRPVGRFGEHELRCPPLERRKVDRGTSIPRP